MTGHPWRNDPRAVFRWRGTSPRRSRSQARAVDLWRAAAARVWARWDAFQAAPDPLRPGAFAAYLDALDAEEEAAARVADRDAPMPA
jgi:hypothetical protein